MANPNSHERRSERLHKIVGDNQVMNLYPTPESTEYISGRVYFVNGTDVRPKYTGKLGFYFAPRDDLSRMIHLPLDAINVDRDKRRIVIVHPDQVSGELA